MKQLENKKEKLFIHIDLSRKKINGEKEEETRNAINFRLNLKIL